MDACLSEEAVLAFMSGVTVGPQRRAAEAHLASCSDCRRLVSELVRNTGAPSGLPPFGTAFAATVRSAPADGNAAQPQLQLQQQLAPGQVIGGKYEIEWPIGAGGMGVVVSALHKVLGQRVAIKFPTPEVQSSTEGCERLLREARACAQLRSEYAVRLLDVGTLETGSPLVSVPYVVMEHLVGRTLAERLREEGKMSVAEAVDSLVQACDALDEAHGKHIVHRDLKPSNLFETHRFDGSRIVKVLDFGIAKAPAFQGETPLTTTHDIMGSLPYMAPEQLRSTRDIDARADIWSLGVTLRELVTGGLEEVRVQPPGLDKVVKRCLEPDPNLRFASARDLAAALAPFGSGVAKGIVSRYGRLASGALATKTAVAMGAVFVVALFTAIGLGLVSRRAQAPEVSESVSPSGSRPAYGGTSVSGSVALVPTISGAIAVTPVSSIHTTPTAPVASLAPSSSSAPSTSAVAAPSSAARRALGGPAPRASAMVVTSPPASSPAAASPAAGTVDLYGLQDRK